MSVLICKLCSKARPSLHCNACEAVYCTECDRIRHLAPHLKLHERTNIAGPGQKLLHDVDSLLEDIATVINTPGEVEKVMGFSLFVF
jgi:hypothetical protein